MTKTSLIRMLLAAGSVSLLLWSSPAQAQAPAEDSLTIPAPKIPWFVVETRHRMYPSFLQIDTVRVDQVFLVGEEELEARIIQFNPHLGITTEGERLQMSDTLYNPAIEVEVKTDGEVSQTSWGFYYTEAPHYYRDQMLGFRILTFEVGEAYVANPKEK